MLELARTVDELMNKATRNERILIRFMRLERKLVAAQTIQALLERITVGYEQDGGSQRTTISLLDPLGRMEKLVRRETASIDKSRVIFFVESSAQYKFFESRRGKSFLGDFEKEQHSIFFPSAEGLRSIAIFPLIITGTFIGCISIGSSSRTRFSADKSTDFLGHYCSIAAIALSNSVAHAQLAHRANSDSLTGLKNRAFFMNHLESALQNPKRGLIMTCILLDIDKFKAINDTHGHSAGDKVIRTVASQVATQFKTKGISCRYGGEEFAAIFRAKDVSRIMAVAEKLRTSIECSSIEISEGHQVNVTVSIGVAVASFEDLVTKPDADYLVNLADSAMYQSKKDGRNRVTLRRYISG